MKAPALFLLAAPLAWATPSTTTLPLLQDPGFNTITITVDVPLIGADSDTSNLSGSILVDLEINQVTDEVSELTAVSGDIVGAGVSFSRSAFLVGSYNVSSTAIGADVFTLFPPGLVEPEGGNFDASQHAFSVNDGTLSGSFTLLGATSPLRVSFASAPVAGAGSGLGNVSLARIAETSTSRTYDVTVVSPVAVADTFDTGSGILVDVTANGTLKVAGTASTTFTPYEFWTYANGIEGAPFLDDANGDAVPNGLVWALGLSATDNPIPHLPDATVAVPAMATITLPAGGTAAPIRIEGALSPQRPWTPVEAGAISIGFNPVPAGTSGPITYAFPAGCGAFARLAASEP